jgi:Rps23 Pro-64 3,4-dihydroxylase Tpa1-like proline 4-hydroxylase
MHLSDYCVKIDNHMNNRVCDLLVDVFNENEKNAETKDLGTGTVFDQYNFTQYSNDNDRYIELHNKCIDYLFEALNEYRSKVEDFNRWAPDGAIREHGFESLRIKRYHDEDHFEPHVDVSNHDDARRYLIMIWYLNDADGGEISFENFDFELTPKKGTLVMFPPHWMFPHKAAKVNSGAKYMLHSYAHYL